MARLKRKSRNNKSHEFSVALVEANLLAAEIFTSVLSRYNICAVQHYKSFAQFADKLKEGNYKPEIVVLDRGSFPQITSNDVSGLRAVAGRPIIMVDDKISQNELCRFIYAGIQGFLAYSAVQDDLFPAIRSVLQGQLWFDKDVLETYVCFVANLNKRKTGEVSVFTGRQKQIVDCLKAGLSNKEISAQLGISESTVKFHIAKIFAKLDVHDRRVIIRAAVGSTNGAGPPEQLQPAGGTTVNDARKEKPADPGSEYRRAV
jgi:DNA-binding NarL/FixJ family response regulator